MLREKRMTVDDLFKKAQEKKVGGKTKEMNGEEVKEKAGRYR